MPHALIAGISGVIGRHIAAELGPHWKVTGMARRFSEGFQPRVTRLPADLLDPTSLERALLSVPDATHLFYCAFAPASSWDAATGDNARMFANLLGLAQDLPRLERVVLVTGTKIYGTHLGPLLTPILEDDPRHAPPNFYFDQVDTLLAAQRGRSWSWSELRPQTLCGISPGTPMSLATILAVYGTVCRELGIAMRFPGSPRAYETLYQVTDAGLFGRTAEWAATSPMAANQAYNVTNGDPFRWRRMWPRVARALGVEPGPPASFSLREFMAGKEALWDTMVRSHGLQPYGMAQLANWQFGDYVLGNEWDILSSLTKLRLHGFTEVVDSGAMFERLFGLMREARLTPSVKTQDLGARAPLVP